MVRSPLPEVRRWGNLKETLLRFQRLHDFQATFEALTVGELAGDYLSALGSHREELLRQHVSGGAEGNDTHLVVVVMLL